MSKLTRLELGSLVHHTGLVDPKTALTLEHFFVDSRRDTEPRISCVIPVHNQETRILACLEGIAASCSETYEIITIVDNCSDQTIYRVRNWMEERVKYHRGSTFVGGTIVENRGPDFYETLCDNIGFSLSRAEIIIEIQADMALDHPGFDSLFCQAFQEFPELFAISGRGGHLHNFSEKRSVLRRRFSRWVERIFDGLAKFRGEYRPSRIEYLLSDSIGRIGRRIDFPLALPRCTQIFWTGTVMRGPLGLRNSGIRRLGMLDSLNYFLGDDDHDLMYRARTELGMSVGYMPIKFSAPLEFGTMRSQKSAPQRCEFDRLRAFYSQRQATLYESRAPLPRPIKRVSRLETEAKI